jgi:tryptophan-rich sensory protein
MDLEVLSNIGIPILLACIVNGMIFALGWGNRSQTSYKGLPPGWAIGMIWVVILGLLGYCRWLLKDHYFASAAITFIIIFCISYPFYTLGLQENIGRFMNVVTLILALFVGVIVVITNATALWFYSPLVLWASYVNVAQTL